MCCRIIEVICSGSRPVLNEDFIRERIVEKMPDASVKVTDLTGGGDHWQVEVISIAFEGVSPVNQHRLVYGCFSDVIGGAMHALALKTSTPS